MASSTNQLELGIDIETFSSVDIKNGAYAYSEAPDFEILLIAYKFSDEDKVKLIDLTDDPEELENLRFWDALTDPAVVKTAYNANFERTCLARHTGEAMPPEQWRCTMVLAVQLGLPRSLAAVGPALGLTEEEQKKKTGAALIQYFCKPCKPTRTNGQRTKNTRLHAPEKWELFKEYNIQDVATEQIILKRLRDFRPDQSEQDLWTLDQEINDRGVLLDIPMAGSIVEFDTERSADLLAEAQQITGLSNPNSLAQLKPWLADNGLATDTLRKDDVAAMLGDPSLHDNVRRVLEIRQTLSKTSVKKYQTMLDIAGEDDRARGIMQFYGGHTGRWAGRSLQPQNLARNTMPDDELDVAREFVKMGDFESLEMIFGEPAPIFSQLVRTAFIPSPGNRFVVSDFSAIEARVIAWIAGEEWRLEVFRNDGDIYCESASHIYHVPVVKHGINGELRQRGKVAELALGYGGAVGAMKQMDTSGSVPEDEMQGIVTQWRAESPKIVRMWRDCQDAAVAVIRGNQPKRVLRSLQGTEFYVKLVDGTPVLFIQLPSGRPIAYWDPKIMDTEMGPRITYMAQNQTTRKWERHETYGGKLTENIVQSVARDCLAEKMKLLESMGYPIVFHVHDEMILDVPREDKEAAALVDRIMGEPIDWAPGLPLKGGTYECDFYRKD
ncbi:MAG: DNA polymerase [Bacteroidales bacterium]|nr:DNA polymerase [Candidatus Liminaster caballi]